MIAETGSGGSLRGRARSELPVILIAAVVQGFGLYALHRSIESATWPATAPGTLVALYLVAALVPLTVQMLARHVRRLTTWVFVAALVALYLLVGWHFGEWVIEEGALTRMPERMLVSAMVVGLQWLMVLPFVQARLAEGRWRSRYQLLFSSAWNNKLVLAEAAVFAGLFWLLLFLWAQLFRMLGILFFSELFDEPIFIYPVTAIVFGIALHLIGSLERLTQIVLEQTLNLLKWLGLVAGLILALFTVALVFELPGMISSGERAIAAVWLLWLIAGTVLLVNAAYRDGSIAQPYPRAIGTALRCVVPLTVVIALVAIYALWLRIDQYGLTVSRFWGCVVAGAALLYSAGYALAVRDGGQWMRRIAGVNVVAALYLIAVLTLALTPVLSPYRLAANSQFRMALADPSPASDAYYYRASPMTYLRFDSGKYGRNRLEELGRIENHPRAAEIRREAAATLARANRYGAVQYDGEAFLASIVVQPAGRTLDPALRATLLKDETMLRGYALSNAWQTAGLFVDLDRDGIEEFVLVQGYRLELYRNANGVWRQAGNLSALNRPGDEAVARRAAAGEFSVAEPDWDDLVIGNTRYRVLPDVSNERGR